MPQFRKSLIPAGTTAFRLFFFFLIEWQFLGWLSPMLNAGEIGKCVFRTEINEKAPALKAATSIY